MKAALCFGILGLVASTLAWAGPGVTVPEPGTFELLALGGLVALVIGIRNRRRNKK